MNTEQRTVTANGITQAVRVAGPPDGTPVLLIHGNCSSALFWEPLVRRLPPTLRVVAPTFGVRRLRHGPGGRHPGPAGLRRRRGRPAGRPDTLRRREPPGGGRALLGGGVAMRLLVDHPHRVGALLLAAPVSRTASVAPAT
ncbi:hypothetical protein NKG94_43310 [Micromonospora sp. M12]